MQKLTAHQACSETRDLWTGIAREAEKGRHRKKSEIPGPWPNYCNRCPCCQYVSLEINRTIFLDCTLCPMAPEWKNFNPLAWDNPAENYFCESYITPYLKWSSGPKHYGCCDLSFFAWLIVELAEEAMERIEEEEAAP